MKSISAYSNTIALFIIVMFAILIMNLISISMLIRLSKKKEEKQVNDSYFFEGFELCLL